jgi:hypothetical protein
LLGGGLAGIVNQEVVVALLGTLRQETVSAEGGAEVDDCLLVEGLGGSDAGLGVGDVVVMGKLEICALGGGGSFGSDETHEGHENNELQHDGKLILLALCLGEAWPVGSRG